MTVSPTATRLSVKNQCCCCCMHLLESAWWSMIETTYSPAAESSVILMTPPCLSLLKHLIKVQGGCHQMTVSPTAKVDSEHLLNETAATDGTHPRHGRLFPPIKTPLNIRCFRANPC